MIIGTAGHIDHGKTALVRALTGVDTDRLPEEKRRGITIDLGFAPLQLDGGLRAGVVDVPGHEAFVRTMLAGATGVDVALLIIAADEGVMPQTREHVDILTLLGVRHAVVVLTKCDLVDGEWTELVTEDVRALLAATPLAGAPIVATSVVTGAGLGELRIALAAALRAVPSRRSDDLFRMPIDRAFTVKGSGTVVTGTVWSGCVRRDEVLQLFPLGTEHRVRGIQVHGAAVTATAAGSRAALALVGVDAGSLQRGAVLVGGAGWNPTRRLRADVALLERGRSQLRPRERVRLHLGTSDVAARIVAVGGALSQGEEGAARVVLDEAIIARAGDRFVLRWASPSVTIGGGIVRDPYPAHFRVRQWPVRLAHSGERLAMILAESGLAGVALDTLPVRLGEPPASLGDLLSGAGAEAVAGRAVSSSSISAASTAIVGAVERSLAAHPLVGGVPVSTVRAAAPASDAIFTELLKRTVAAGRLEAREGLLTLPGWSPKLDAMDLALRASVIDRLAAAGSEPPSTAELAAEYGQKVIAVLRILERERLVIPVEPGGSRYYEAAVVDQMVRRLRQTLADGGVHTPAALREVMAVSRKFLIPFLEYCDRVGVTERRDGGRVLGRQASIESSVP
ncbi:MAG: selenocysteine-specific translation elongation factor [Gemmatimonadaceae bacterium]